MNEIFSNDCCPYVEAEKFLAGARSSVSNFGNYDIILLLIATTGISLPEVLRLEWDDVDFEDRSIFIRSSPARKIKICRSVVTELKGMLTGEWVCELVFHEPDGSRLNPLKFAKDMREIRELAGVSSSTGINSLRLLHGRRLLDLKVHPDVICERFGQESGQYMIDQYFKVRDQETAVKVMEEDGRNDLDS